jgi:hypothetical protein
MKPTRKRRRSAINQATPVSAPEAVEKQLERDRLEEILDKVWREHPMTKSERAWADQILQG